MTKATFLLTIFLLLVFSFPPRVRALYDPLSVPNNHIGIHILYPEEIEKAAELVNSSGGDWGYVTIPIRANDRDLLVWQKFMEECGRLHIIPILRIASFLDEDRWVAPNEYDLVDFANFLDQLPWPTKNRYVVIYNEPNHKNEWGGFVYPEEYARVLDRAIDIFHQKNSDFFVISAGMDSSSPNTLDSMNIYDYFWRMNQAAPQIFARVDAVAFHAYGNPGFSSPPNLKSSVNIASFRKEADYLKKQFAITPKIFITESGWRSDLVGEKAREYWLLALDRVWNDGVVAVTPFVLQAQDGPFSGFSFLDRNGELYSFARVYKDYPKIKGQPMPAEIRTTEQERPVKEKESTTQKKSPIMEMLLGLLDLFSRVLR